MWKYVLLALLILPDVITAQYSRVEYFIDTDPGYGKATSVTLPQNDECNFTIDMNAVSDGFHILYIRVKSADERWSKTVSRPFTKMAVAKDDLPEFVKAEYFIDSDPGYGKATAITGITGDSLMFNADLSDIAEGFHTLYLRTLDSRGKWSNAINRPFIKSSIQTSILPDIIAAEYFIDSIGESGSGIPIQITNPSSHTLADFTIELNDVDLGNHTMYMRAKDANGTWGMIQSINFKACPFIQTKIEHSICQGDSFIFGTQTLFAKGEYAEVFTSSGGCDSTVVLTLSVNPSFSKTVAASICKGESYLFDSQSLTTAGEYTKVFQSHLGCDSTVVLNLSVNPIYNQTVTASICPGENYTFGTQTLTAAGEYTEVFKSKLGCDSTVVLNLSVNPIYNQTLTASICPGENYTFGTQTLTAAGEYTEVFKSILGCDSTVELSLTIKEVDTSVSVSGFIILAGKANAEYQWLDCNDSYAPIASATMQSFIAPKNGSYAVEVFQNGCSAISTCIPISSVGIENVDSKKAIQFYPNPNNGVFTISLQSTMDVVIYNSIGEAIYYHRFKSGNHAISVQNLSDGIYILKAQNNQEILIGKLNISK